MSVVYSTVCSVHLIVVLLCIVIVKGKVVNPCLSQVSEAIVWPAGALVEK